MTYYINFKEISLIDYQNKLSKIDLVPSRQILMDDLDEHFKILKNQGFDTVDSLLNVLKNKAKLEKLSLETGIAENYLVILSREIRSMIPKPEKLGDFPEIDASIIDQLKEIGIKTTKQLWEAGILEQQRNELIAALGIKANDLLRLIGLSDLCRVRWVNTTFAHILYMSGVKNTQELSNQDYAELHKKMVHLNDIHQWYKAKIGKKDFKMVVKAAGDLTFDLQL